MNNDDFRLIANPYLLKKNNRISNNNNKENYLYNLESLINKNYKIKIDNEFLKYINIKIDELILDYKREIFIKKFVDECIEKAIKNLIK